MRTIFISIFQGIEARNILRTDIYRELNKNPNVRLILFTNSVTKKEYYQKEFSGHNVIYEVIENYRNSWLGHFFDKLKFRLVYTNTIKIRRGHSTINWLVARRPLRKIVRFLDWHLVKDRSFATYFEKYQPSAVLMAHLFGGIEIAMLREARRRGVTTVGLINSWDKITARCMIRLLPDWMIVHNNIVRADTVRYVDMPEKRIKVMGIPHFDFYINEKRTSRDKFLRQHGIDPQKRIILYFPVGRTRSSFDRTTISLLDELIVSGELPENLQLMVRFPPNDDVEPEKGHKSKIVFQLPGKRFSMKRGTDWDMSFEDFKSLADAIFYSDLVITYPSTTVIDSAVFDKPIINLRLHPEDDWFYQVDHYRPVLKTEGVRIVKSRNELVAWIKEYLKNPSLDKEGRAKIVENECWRLDGQSGKRTANFLLETIKAKDK